MKLLTLQKFDHKKLTTCTLLRNCLSSVQGQLTYIQKFNTYQWRFPKIGGKKCRYQKLILGLRLCFNNITLSHCYRPVFVISVLNSWKIQKKKHIYFFRRENPTTFSEYGLNRTVKHVKENFFPENQLTTSRASNCAI